MPFELLINESDCGGSAEACWEVEVVWTASVQVFLASFALYNRIAETNDVIYQQINDVKWVDLSMITNCLHIDVDSLKWEF